MRRIKKYLLILLVCIIVLYALVYGGHLWWLRNYGASPQPVPSEILNLDQTFTSYPAGFPPDPGEYGKRTIAGIDSDRDGVRDDVQRWIYAFVPNEPKKQFALRQQARFFQKYMLSDRFDSEIAREAWSVVSRSNQCMSKVFTDEARGYSEGVYIKAKVLNTFVRVKRYWDNNSTIKAKDVQGGIILVESPCDNQ